jgi:transcriptional regulator with XRE-family HTH domain
MRRSTKKPGEFSVGKPDIALGKRIRLRRVEQKISQAELGEKLGVSFQQVQKYEKGVNRVGVARLRQIANALDVPVTFFYDGDIKAREVQSLLFLDSAFSLRLLRAYSKIKNQTSQRQFHALMAEIAASDATSPALHTANPETVSLEPEGFGAGNVDSKTISEREFWGVIEDAAAQFKADRIDSPEAHAAYIRDRISAVFKS